MSEQSIDRKLARCAREIEAARKPTMAEACEAFLINTAVNIGGGIYTFLTEDDCRQIKGAAKREQAETGASTPAAQADAAPPSAQKFKPGDRVRLSAEVVRLNRLKQEFNLPFVIARIADGNCYDSNGSYAGLDQIEFAPEPKAEDGLVVGMPYWCETIWKPCFSVWLGDGNWFGCTPDAKLLRDLFLCGKSHISYKTGNEITRVVRMATEAELGKP